MARGPRIERGTRRRHRPFLVRPGGHSSVQTTVSAGWCDGSGASDESKQVSTSPALTIVMPWFSALFLAVCLSSIAVPGFNGFVGEFLILVGSWPTQRTATVLASLGVILAAAYLLWMVQRVLYGEVTNAKNQSLPDLSPREIAVVAPLVALALFMGVASPAFT